MRIRPHGRLSLVVTVSVSTMLAGCTKNVPKPHVDGDEHALAQDAGALLPDLVTVPPKDLAVRYATLASGARQKQLRLSNTVRNIGKGPLHMLGLKATDPKPWERDHLSLEAAPAPAGPPAPHDDGSGTPTDDDAKGYQVIEVKERHAGVFTRWVPRSYFGPVGNMFFHRAHGHIHFADFARYLVLNQNLVPAPGIQPGRKVSFCIEDVGRWARGDSIEGMPASGRFGCGMEQGISPGWEDTYGSGLEGQYVDVTNLPDGKYYCYTAATRAFRETDVTNNDSATLFEIRGDTVKVIEELDNAKLQGRARQIQHDLGLLTPLLPPPNPNPPPQPTAPTAPATTAPTSSLTPTSSTTPTPVASTPSQPPQSSGTTTGGIAGTVPR